MQSIPSVGCAKPAGPGLPWCDVRALRALVRCVRVLLLLAAGSAMAQDQVEIAAAGGGRALWTGRILDFNGQNLVLQAPGGHEQTFPAGSVQRAETAQGEQHRAADGAWAQADFNQALVLYRKALQQESRQWVRRRILARIVGCYQALGSTATAGDTFLLLASSDPPPQDFASIPLAWMAPLPAADLEQAAKTWLTRPEPVAKLLGASYLLMGADGDAARRALDALIRSADPVLTSLARAQQWRTAVATASKEELDTWEQSLESLPEALRGGPYYVLGQGRLHRQQWDQAAWTLLRVPIAYPRDRELAARALLDAGKALEKLGRAPDAAALYREVIETYPASSSVTEAERRLKPS